LTSEEVEEGRFAENYFLQNSFNKNKPQVIIVDAQPPQEVAAEVVAEIGNVHTQIQNLQLQLQTAQHALQQQQPIAAIPAPQPTLKLIQPDKYGTKRLRKRMACYD
jgi:response regulator RpfG family c-di-GMP phosphodiesterase